MAVMLPSCTNPARHHRRGHHHRDDERRLDVADDGDPASGLARRDVLERRAPPRGPPADEGERRPDLEDQDREQKSHLAEKDVVAEVVSGRLLRLAEEPPEAGHDPDERGDPPRRIGAKGATHRGGGDRLAERGGSAEDRAEADAKGEEVQRGEDDAKHGQRLRDEKTAALARWPLRWVRPAG